MSENKKVVQEFHDRILNESRYDLSRDLVHDDAVFSLNQHGELVGIEAFKQHLSPITNAFPDLAYTTLGLTEENNIVTLYWEANGTQTNPLGNIPATGKKVTVRGLSLFYVKEGRIQENIVFYNEMEIPKQLGVL